MNGRDFDLAGARLTARPSGALWWACEGLLCVADLHLCKSARVARRAGQILPPYETRDTLVRLGAEIDALDPACVVCLGDSFDDCEAAGHLGADDALLLTALQAGRDWVWIAGNHDDQPLGVAGAYLAELALAPVIFRHIAAEHGAAGEISGHYHPKARLSLRGKMVSRPCFLLSAERLILPAFGTYTGGLECRAPTLRGLFPDGARVLLTGPHLHEVPLAACS